MGCFLGCFGTRKNRRRQRRRENVHPRENKLLPGTTKDDHLHAKVSTVEEVPKSSVIPFTDISGKDEEKSRPSTMRKRVTFDTNVKTYEHILPDESVEFSKETEEKAKREEKSVKSNQTQSSSEDSSMTSSSAGSFPPNHRYQNCRESDEEEEDELDYRDSDPDDDIDDDDDALLDDGYYEDDGYYGDKSYNRAKEVYTEEIADNGLDVKEIGAEPRGSNASARDRSGYVHSVLNPVENLTQWRAVKSKGRTIPTLPQKENLVSDQEETRALFSSEPKFEELSFSFNPKSSPEAKKTKNQELAVDASLSTWLSTPETACACNSGSVGFEAATPEKSVSYESKSVRSHDDRPILGALTVEEIKQFSASSSPRKSPSRSPDETPIIGTVGGYWNHSGTAKDSSGSATSFKGIPNTTSKYREDKRVNWHSTPFETRLERALNKAEAGVAET